MWIIHNDYLQYGWRAHVSMGAWGLITNQLASPDLWLTPALGWVMCFVFGWAGLYKVLEPQHVGTTLQTLGIWWPTTVARILGLTELIIAGLIAVVPQTGAGLAAFVLAGYTAFVASQLGHDKAVPCNCFGGSDTRISQNTLVRNLVLFSGILVVLVAPPTGTIISANPLASALSITGIASLLIVARDSVRMSRSVVTLRNPT